jgi:hypothetical protein
MALQRGHRPLVADLREGGGGCGANGGMRVVERAFEDETSVGRLCLTEVERGADTNAKVRRHEKIALHVRSVLRDAHTGPTNDRREDDRAERAPEEQ